MDGAPLVAILLAAGRGERFGDDKRLAVLSSGPDRGVALAVASCRRLVAAVPHAVAVVGPGDATLAGMLRDAGARVVECARAAEGMGASLACGVAASSDAGGWLVALADMPWIEPSTVARVADALRGGASLAAPRCAGRRGHPVGFAAAFRDALLGLRGDKGAQTILAQHVAELVLLDVDDVGVLRDVDAPQDLRGS